jgi:histidinol-phosphatase (PHP family)
MEHSDFHVHTQFSWDAPRGDLEESCRQALELGLPAIAFTDHADFLGDLRPDMYPVDVPRYLEEIERCRALFPCLRILSGVELGEPHLYPEQAAAVLASGRLDRVLGSVHNATWQGALMDCSEMDDLGELGPRQVQAFLHAYFAETLALVTSSQPFEVLAHLDYPRRYLPDAVRPYKEEDYEEEYRAVLRALAARGSTLEVNTTRGIDPVRGLCPGPLALRWWVEEGGRSLSFGSDAHDPTKIAAGFRLAAQLAEAAGFRPSDDPTGFWIR